MLLRALLAVPALPGIIAIAVPAWLAAVERSAGTPFHGVGLVPLATEFALLLWCVRDFDVAGQGTLAPWSPPRHLVTVGLYRFSRNPMYVAVALMLVGWTIFASSRALAIYTGFVIVAFHLRVLTSGRGWRRHAWRGVGGIPLARAALADVSG